MKKVLVNFILLIQLVAICNTGLAEKFDINKYYWKTIGKSENVSILVANYDVTYDSDTGYLNVPLLILNNNKNFHYYEDCKINISQNVYKDGKAIKFDKSSNEILETENGSETIKPIKSPYNCLFAYAAERTKNFLNGRPYVVNTEKWKYVTSSDIGDVYVNVEGIKVDKENFTLSVPCIYYMQKNDRVEMYVYEFDTQKDMLSTKELVVFSITTSEILDEFKYEKKSRSIVISEGSIGSAIFKFAVNEKTELIDYDKWLPRAGAVLGSVMKYIK